MAKEEFSLSPSDMHKLEKLLAGLDPALTLVEAEIRLDRTGDGMWTVHRMSDHALIFCMNWDDGNWLTP